MRFAPLQFKMLLGRWSSMGTKLFRAGEQVGEVDRFDHLFSRILPVGRASEEMSLCTQITRLAFTNLGHMWHLVINQ